MAYQVKLEFISAEQDPVLYDLEDKIYEAMNGVLEYRAKNYQEHYWQDSLPTTLFTILDHWDREASRAACETYLSLVVRIKK